jgi:GNAT superfamily N-acetyltransferase
MSRRDFEAVFRLVGQLSPERDLDAVGPPEGVQSRACSDSQIYLCAEDGEDVVGFASLMIKNNLSQATNLGHIDELIVEQSCRGRGLGTRLLGEIIACAREKGCARVELDSAFHRRKAHRFYGRHGFENRAYVFSKSLT